MANTYDSLRANGFEPEKERVQRRELSIKEKGVSYVMQLKERRYTSVFQVDGKIIREGNKCDKLVVVDHFPNDGWTNVFVELKGSDIYHAVVQLESTLCHPFFSGDVPARLCARVVSTSMPGVRNNPEWERAKRRFLQKYNCELKRVKSCQPDIFKE